MTTRWNRIAARFRDDEGSTLILTIGLGALTLALILAVAAATSLYIERRQLFSLADGAALAAAESFALESVVVEGGSAAPTLTDDAVAAVAAEYLTAAPTSLDSVQLVSAGTDDGETATVTLASVWNPPVLNLFFPEGFAIEVTVTSRSVFQD